MDQAGRHALGQIVNSLAQDVHANVSSLYSWTPALDRLRLEATFGLSQAVVGQLTMKSSEGLTGMVIERGAPVSVKYPSNHPRYRYVPGSTEERLCSYLGVPVGMRGRGVIGVVTVQTESPKMFTMTEIEFVVHAAERMAPVLAAALGEELAMKSFGQPVSTTA